MVPGRAFTARLYAMTAGIGSKGSSGLLPHHHIKITQEMKMDMLTWLKFLDDPMSSCHPLMDFTKYWNAEDLFFYSDASKNFDLGFGGICQTSWMFTQWDSQFLSKRTPEPSIQYLELFALTAAVLAWVGRFRNKRIVIFCDKMSVVQMINNSTSKCRNCMMLLRMVTLECMKQNVRLFA